MKVIKKIVQTLYIFWVFLVFTVFMLLFLPMITIPFLFGTRISWIGYAFLKAWSRIFSILTFIHYYMYGRENFKKGKSYIYVSNHTSFLDIPGVCLTIPGEFRPLAKKELLKLPVFGMIARGAAIIVDRSSPESRKKSIDKLKQVLKKGINILLFAEGTQNRSKEVLQPFHDGAFRIAIDAQQPIIPIVIIGAGKLMPPGTVKLRPGKIKIMVGKEIETRGLTTADSTQLKMQTFDIMKEMIVRNQ